MIESGMYGQIRAPKQPNMLEQYAQMQQLQAGQAQNRLSELAFADRERGVADEQAVRQAYQQSAGDPNKLMQLLQGGGQYKQAQSIQKSIGESQKMQDDSAKTQAEILDKSLNVFRSQVGQVNSPEMAGQYAGAMYDNPVLGKFAANFGTREESVNRNIDAFGKDPRAWMAGAAGLTADKLIELTRGTRQNTNVGNVSRGQTINAYGEVVPGQTMDTPIGQSADNAATQVSALARDATTQRRQDMTAGTAAAGRAQSALQRGQNLAKRDGADGQGGKAPTGYRFTQDGNLQAIPGGPADLKINAAGVTKVNDANDVIALLDEAGPLLKKATSSYIGVGVDMAGRLGGYGTSGAAAAAQLKALEGALISKMPKMSGPQSDKDVLLYKQMAGQIGDATMPVSTREAAIKTIRKMNEKYANLGGASGGWDAQKHGSGLSPTEQAELIDLRRRLGK